MEGLGQEFVLYQLFGQGFYMMKKFLKKFGLIVKDWKFNEIKNFYKNVRKNGLKANTPIMKAF